MKGKTMMSATPNRISLLIGIMIAVMATEDRCLADETSISDPRFQKLYLDEAKRWEMWIGPDHKRKAELVADPVFRWQNLVRERGQSGAMYVWALEGRPVVIGGVFSNPAGNNRRDIIHEFHALSPEQLFPEFRNSQSKWLPKAAVKMEKLPDSPDVEETAAKRMLQLRAIGRDFAAISVDDQNQRWQLRLLPKPLYRYDKPQGNIIDGALLAFLSDAGTDPEIILILEARQEANRKIWFYRTIRLSISDLYVDYKGQRIWTSLRKDLSSTYANEDSTYFLLRERDIDELPNLPQK
jgi:hypothetical protein